MNRKVLILNQDYRPISVCTVKRAFLLIFLKKTELVESANGYTLNSVSRSFPMPSVIRLMRYVNVPYSKVALTRQNIFKRDNFSCQYCGTTKDLTLDHVVPRSRGGVSAWTNLVSACKRCNALKGDNTPDEAGIKLRTRPYRPTFTLFLRHFSGGNLDEWQPYLNDHKT